jgi:hypothetical protein
LTTSFYSAYVPPFLLFILKQAGILDGSIIELVFNLGKAFGYDSLTGDGVAAFLQGLALHHSLWKHTTLRTRAMLLERLASMIAAVV